MHKLYGLLCILIGASMTWAGHRILKRHQRPPEVTGFAGRIAGSSLLIVTLSNLLVICGLVLAVVFGLVFFLN